MEQMRIASAERARKFEQAERDSQSHALAYERGMEELRRRRAEEAEIERLTQAITRGFHDCHRAIQRIERLVRDNGKNPGAMTRAEETMAKNVQISLAARVQEASANFRKKQSAYLKSMSCRLTWGMQRGGGARRRPDTL